MITEINKYIKMWERRCYSNGIPDEAPKEIDDRVPSYKRIAIAILKNDLSYIGIEPIKSEYYSILKCIELNIVYKKSKRMTQQEVREFTFKLINNMVTKKCYIKGYGDKFRVVDITHSPFINIDKMIMKILQFNKIVVRAGLIYQLDVVANPFSHPIDIKLPNKE